MRCFIVSLLLALPLAAHPLPTLRFDRTVEVRLTAAGVDVRYVVELNEWSMVLDRDAQPTAKEGEAIRAAKPSLKAGERLYATKKAVRLPTNFLASINGVPLQFRSAAAPEMHPNRDHLEFRFRFVADWPAGLDRSRPVHFLFEDSNYESVTGKLALTLRAESSLNVIDLVDSGGLRGLSPLDLKPGDEIKLRKVSAVFELPRRAVEAAAVAPPQEAVIAGEKLELVDDLRARGVKALFDSDAGTALLLVAALLFGMAHAFTPGHGKTMVAAYLVGERGTIRHALVLGLTTTIAHTGSVIAIAVVLWTLYRDAIPQTTQGWLQLCGGLFILIVGLWLLSQRLRGRADHVHLFHDQRERRNFGWGRVLLLGLGGGLIPCWDAVLLLLAAISVERLAFAIPMLIAFSLGLALVLVALGIGVVLAHRAGLSRYGDRGWFKSLPLVSAVALVLMGLYLAREGVQQLSNINR